MASLHGEGAAQSGEEGGGSVAALASSVPQSPLGASPARPGAAVSGFARGRKDGDPEDVDTLRMELTRERQRNASLAQEVQRLKRVCAESISQAETEEECIINRMMKRLSDLKREKEALAIEVEREEELLTNTMSKRLTEAIRAQMEAEEQVERLSAENEELKTRLTQLQDGASSSTP
uniref:Uncharacterized protein n=1 Tax=Rhizochromulina marina TaxID=1034831 RepID=A0A7S2RXB8_9STRA|mmetsp:Transcript_22178/g.64371  ORF Transcript_22178/g.64371 Transcript_22178/m.64371 type:complete len:178 (+) Transcript_22178:40-573(+)